MHTVCGCFACVKNCISIACDLTAEKQSCSFNLLMNTTRPVPVGEDACVPASATGGDKLIYFQS